MNFKEVKDEGLWKQLQLTFIEAMTIFIFTIAIGLVNALNLLDANQSVEFEGEVLDREFTRAELLFHLHSGVIGWLSLSSVAILIWYFVGDRDLDEISLNRAKKVLRTGQLVIPFYVFFFYLSFTLAKGDKVFRLFSVGDGSDYWFILMILGALATVFGVFAQAAYFGVTELPKLEVKTTPHYLFIGAMFTSTYGGFFGFILELQNFLDTSLYDRDAGQDGTGAHAAAMEAGYLYMMVAGILEWQIHGDKIQNINLSGKLEVFTLFFAGLALSIGAGFNLVALAGLNLPLLLIGFLLIVIRVGIKINPKTVLGTEPSRFYLPALLSMAFSVSFFLYIVSQLVGGKDFLEIISSPLILGIGLANEHGLFVGAMTGSVLAVLLVMFKDANEVGKMAENIGFALMYIGLFGFMLMLILRGSYQENNEEVPSWVGTHIASLMGIGLYTLIGVIFARYRKINSS